MHKASVPSPSALTPRFSTPVSPAANLTSPFSPIFRPTLIIVAKTASFTPSSLMVPSSVGLSPFVPVRSSTAMVLSFAIYCPLCKEPQNELGNLAKRKSALSHASRSCHDPACCCAPHRASPVELHARRRDGSFFWSTHSRSPPGGRLSAACAFCG